MNKKDIVRIIEEDKWMMDILLAAASLNLPDWWIGAGFVRSKVWDHLHGHKKRTPLPDIDLIYFDLHDFSQKEAGEDTTGAEGKYEGRLQKIFPSVKWSVTNQARMHLFHKRPPYRNSVDALSNWAETATCVGVKIQNGKLFLIAPHGIEDLVDLIIRPIPNYQEKYKHDPQAFERRMTEKEWLKKWPKLRIIT